MLWPFTPSPPGELPDDLFGAVRVKKSSSDHPLDIEIEGDANSKVRLFIAEVRVLDQRSLSIFGSVSDSRQELWGLLYNAAVSGATDIDSGQTLLKEARDVYAGHLNTRNRLLYLQGLLLGTLFLGLIAIVLLLLPKNLQPDISPRLLLGLFLFSGMGALASVLARLSSLNLGPERSRAVLRISGASRPVVAVIFAVVVYLALAMGVVSVGSGTSSAYRDDVYLIAAFLSGFSERFAQDIITSIPFGRRRKDSQETPTS